MHGFSTLVAVLVGADWWPTFAVYKAKMYNTLQYRMPSALTVYTIYSNSIH